jgi:SAM-dependent methyltransferase
MLRDLPPPLPTVSDGVTTPTVSDTFGQWLDTPPGRLLLAWEQQQFDSAVADVFGYYAVQCGLPTLDGLRASRMSTRVQVASPLGLGHAQSAGYARVSVSAFEELPFAAQSVDLAVLPHVLETANDPHEVLREAERVLRPDGRLVISGINPVSLWGVRQRAGSWIGRPFLPDATEPISVLRLRDWAKLLGFELSAVRFGLYGPACRTEKWQARFAWMDSPGDRFWPICGAAYVMSAIKRVRGMRVIGPVWRAAPARAPAAVGAPAPRSRPVEPAQVRDA